MLAIKYPNKVKILQIHDFKEKNLEFSHKISEKKSNPMLKI